MSRETMEHPSEDELVRHALDEETRAEIAEHLSGCEQCRRYVAQVASVRDGIESLPEEEVPDRVRKRIMDTPHKKVRPSESWFALLRGNPTPLLIGLGVVLGTLFLYFTFMFMR